MWCVNKLLYALGDSAFHMFGFQQTFFFLLLFFPWAKWILVSRCTHSSRSSSVFFLGFLLRFISGGKFLISRQQILIIIKGQMTWCPTRRQAPYSSLISLICCGVYFSKAAHTLIVIQDRLAKICLHLYTFFWYTLILRATQYLFKKKKKNIKILNFNKKKHIFTQ